MASKALTERAVIARARNYGLEVDRGVCEVEALRETVEKLDALPVDVVSPTQVVRLIAALNEGEDWSDAMEYAMRPRTRRGVIRAVRSRREAEAYLPANYRVVGELPAQLGGDRLDLWIEGEDDHGWTLDSVIDRLHSGLIFCDEVKA